MTMNGMFHLNISRLYLPRAEGGRGLLSLADSVNIERRSLNCRIWRTEENLLKIAQIIYLKAGEVGPKAYKRERKKDTKIGKTNHFMEGSYGVLKK